MPPYAFISFTRPHMYYSFIILLTHHPTGVKRIQCNQSFSSPGAPGKLITRSWVPFDLPLTSWFSFTAVFILLKFSSFLQIKQTKKFKWTKKNHLICPGYHNEFLIYVVPTEELSYLGSSIISSENGSLKVHGKFSVTGSHRFSTTGFLIKVDFYFIWA